MERVFDKLDGYSPVDGYPNVSVKKAPEHKDGAGPWGALGKLGRFLGVVRSDGYQNTLTGIGDPSRDKTYGGRFNGPDFVNQFLTGWEAQERWRGGDLGGRVVETIPREMVRKGWNIQIQPEPKDAGGSSTDDEPTEAAAPQLPPAGVALARRDFGAAPAPGPTHEPEELSEESDDTAALVAALVKEQERLGLAAALELALSYERNYGGGAVFVGVDDGEKNLTEPLDWSKVQSIKHLTVFRGGWDGEVIAYNYYVDPTAPNFGRPRVYQLRNLGVTVDMPAPNEKEQRKASPAALITYVHESRFLIFDGDPKSITARVQMRGWGDGIWMRINQVLSQYSQSWEGVAIMMQELGVPILKMEGFADLVAAADSDGMNVIAQRALALSMSMSIAKVRILDTTETLERLQTRLSGVAEVLREFALRIAAAAGMPFSMLMGQVQGGLGDASKGDISFFDDQIIGLQASKLVPALQMFVGLQFAAKKGVSKGVTPERWSVTPNPQREMTPSARADYVAKVATADAAYVNAGVVTPEEVAATRFGTSVFNDGPIVLDFEERKRAASMATTLPPYDPNEDPNADPNAPAQDPNAAGLTTMEPDSSLTADAADFVTRNGRVKVKTSVSVVVAFGPDGKALMGTRRDSGKLAFPGGHAEPGEDPLSTAVRELFEETGLHPKRISLVGRKTHGDTLSHVVVSVFRALVDGEPDASHDPDREFVSFRWVALKDGDYPDDVKAALHHANDVVGPILRRR